MGNMVSAAKRPSISSTFPTCTRSLIAKSLTNRGSGSPASKGEICKPLCWAVALWPFRPWWDVRLSVGWQGTLQASRYNIQPRKCNLVSYVIRYSSLADSPVLMSKESTESWQQCPSLSSHHSRSADYPRTLLVGQTSEYSPRRDQYIQ